METETTRQPGDEMPDEVPTVPPGGSVGTGTDQGEGTDGDLHRHLSPEEPAEGVGE
jgi:hypothetical protein